MRVHWAWVPAGVFVTAGAWLRFGPLATVLTGAAGLGLGLLIEWRARRRRRSP